MLRDRLYGVLSKDNSYPGYRSQTECGANNEFPDSLLYAPFSVTLLRYGLLLTKDKLIKHVNHLATGTVNR